MPRYSRRALSCRYRYLAASVTLEVAIDAPARVESDATGYQEQAAKGYSMVIEFTKIVLERTEYVKYWNFDFGISFETKM